MTVAATTTIRNLVRTRARASRGRGGGEGGTTAQGTRRRGGLLSPARPAARGTIPAPADRVDELQPDGRREAASAPAGAGMLPGGGRGGGSPHRPRRRRRHRADSHLLPGTRRSPRDG